MKPTYYLQIVIIFRVDGPLKLLASESATAAAQYMSGGSEEEAEEHHVADNSVVADMETGNITKVLNCGGNREGGGVILPLLSLFTTLDDC